MIPSSLDGRIFHVRLLYWLLVRVVEHTASCATVTRTKGQRVPRIGIRRRLIGAVTSGTTTSSSNGDMRLAGLSLGRSLLLIRVVAIRIGEDSTRALRFGVSLRGAS